MEKKWWKESVVYRYILRVLKTVTVTAWEISEESYKNSITLKNLG